MGCGGSSGHWRRGCWRPFRRRPFRFCRPPPFAGGSGRGGCAAEAAARRRWRAADCYIGGGVRSSARRNASLARRPPDSSLRLLNGLRPRPARLPPLIIVPRRPPTPLRRRHQRDERAQLGVRVALAARNGRRIAAPRGVPRRFDGPISRGVCLLCGADRADPRRGGAAAPRQPRPNAPAPIGAVFSCFHRQRAYFRRLRYAGAPRAVRLCGGGGPRGGE